MSGSTAIRELSNSSSCTECQMAKRSCPVVSSSRSRESLHTDDTMWRSTKYS